MERELIIVETDTTPIVDEAGAFPTFRLELGEVHGISDGVAPRTTVPPAFYRDEEPPEPPDDDPHWREFPLFDGTRSATWIVVGVVVGVLMVTMAHLAVLFFI